MVMKEAENFEFLNIYHEILGPQNSSNYAGKDCTDFYI